MKTRTITGVGILSALTIVLTIMSNYIQIGTVSINLSLIPICITGILYGPLAGAIVGLINGGFVMIAPSTATFFSMSIIGTILVCLTKSTAVGVFSAIFYKLVKNQKVSVIVISICSPIINTGLFILGSLIFFNSIVAGMLTLVMLFNFLVELGLSILLIPTTLRLIKYSESKNKAQ